MKVIFLDVDGVLTHNEYKNPKEENLDPEKILLLKKIIENTEAKIVLISSWKNITEYKGKKMKLKAYYVLEKLLKEKGLKIYDETPEKALKLSVPLEMLKYLPIEEIKKVTHNPNTTRAGEIYTWLSSTHDIIDSFVILDDKNCSYDYFDYNYNFIKTDYFKGGLTEEHVWQAINILNKTRTKKR